MAKRLIISIEADFTYIEMNCIGDYADFVIYDPCQILTDPFSPSRSIWMVPGSWNNRDQFGRKES